MKRKSILLCTLLILSLFIGCGANDDAENTSDTITGANDEETETAADLASQLEVVEYSFENTIGDTLYFLAITNQSDLTVEVGVNAVAKDAEGNIIGAADSDERAIGSGETVCLCNYFNGVTGANSFEYTLNVQEEQYYETVVEELSLVETKTDKKVIVTCTNNGNEAVKKVEVYALFFCNGELMGYDSTSIKDSDREIKAGATLSGELSFSKPYDDVKVFVHGYK